MLKGVEVQGLREFSKALKSLDRELPIELRKGMNSIAKVVADSARTQVPKRSGKLANSIRPSSTQRVGKVTMGNAKVPYAGFIEYGGAVGRKKSVKRAFKKDGRYLRPAYEANRERVQAEMVELVDRTIRKAGLDG